MFFNTLPLVLLEKVIEAITLAKLSGRLSVVVKNDRDTTFFLKESSLQCRVIPHTSFLPAWSYFTVIVEFTDRVSGQEDSFDPTKVAMFSTVGVKILELYGSTGQKSKEETRALKRCAKLLAHLSAVPIEETS